MTPPAGSVVADALATYGTDVASAITTTAAVYVARKARSISRKLDRYDTLLFGDERIEGRDGIANIALENERRSLENRDAIRDVAKSPDNLEHQPADD